MFWWRLKAWFSLLLSVMFVFALGGGVKSANTLKLSHLDGRHTYYLHSSSSQALIQSSISFFDAFHLRGESVVLNLTQSQAADTEGVAAELLTDFCAIVQFEERVNGTISYYAFSKQLGEGIWVNGALVNFHVAIDNNRCVVGTPLIFGGF